jgi:hypothetical protein
VVTDPLCPARPERGSGLARELCDWAGRDVIKKIPKHRIAAVRPIRQIATVFLSLSFISTFLVLN